MQDTNTLTSSFISTVLTHSMQSLDSAKLQESTINSFPLLGLRTSEDSPHKWCQFTTQISIHWRNSINKVIGIDRCGLMISRSAKKQRSKLEGFLAISSVLSFVYSIQLMKVCWKKECRVWESLALWTTLACKGSANSPLKPMNLAQW